MTSRQPFNERAFLTQATTAAVLDLITSNERLVAALRSGLGAIDVLMAKLIESDPSFMPTKSAVWPQLLEIKAALSALAAAEAK